jgi:hypothetical protein
MYIIDTGLIKIQGVTENKYTKDGILQIYMASKPEYQPLVNELIHYV